MDRFDRKLARAVYAMVLLAVLALSLADGSVAFFGVAVLAALLSWPIAHGRPANSATGRPATSPVPRWIISLAVLIALFFFVLENIGGTHLVRALGHFMILVQVCKFFETKRARDYGQLIVVSMLEMIVAAILSTSVFFAVLLVAWLATGGLALLLYHFKREMELFEQAGRGRAGTVNQKLRPAVAAVAGATGSLDGLTVSRFWRLSSTIGLTALTLGVTIFVCFPRGESLIGRFGLNEIQRSVTGFDEMPRLGVGGLVEQSNEVVMHVTVREAGQLASFDGPLLLRGAAAYHYRPNGSWTDLDRLSNHPIEQATDRLVDLSAIVAWAAKQPPPAKKDLDTLREVRVVMDQPQSACLFSPYPPLVFRGTFPVGASFCPENRTLRLDTMALSAPVSYSVWTTRDAQSGDLDWPRPSSMNARDLTSCSLAKFIAEEDGKLSRKLHDLARKWGGSEAQPADTAEALEAKVRAIETHLQTEYRYTLNIPSGRDADYPDPLEAFLFKTRAGHCQYFASAMTVLCQSLKIPARIVTGFKAAEYNSQGGYYIVRARHAHAWVEVRLPGRGWVTFDPTPGGSEIAAADGPLGWFDHAVDYWNFRFQQTVLNYSPSDRQGVVNWMTSTLHSGVNGILHYAGPREAWVGVSAVAFFLLVILSSRKRRKKTRTQLLMLKGLGFWANLLKVLRSARVLPSPALTPREIAVSLSATVPQIPGLSDLGDRYYQVRYGGCPLSPAEQQQVDATIAQLADSLRKKKTPAPPDAGTPGVG